MNRLAALGALATIALSTPALARAPQPARAVAPAMYAGRWYQIAQIAKTHRHPCLDATEDFTPAARGDFNVVISCREPSGKVRRIKASGAVVANSAGAKLRVGFFGGLVSQEYWILDHSLDQSWALMATPGGNYLWLLARRPALDPGARAAALSRVSALGYDAKALASTR